MLNKNEFKASLKKEIGNIARSEGIADVDIMDTEVTKINDQKLCGICIRPHGENAGPTMYIDEMFEAYKHGSGDIPMFARHIVDTYKDVRTKPIPEVDTELSWETVKEKLSVKLLSKDKNTDFLKTVPYEDLGNGLALICVIYLDPEHKEWAINVNNDVLGLLGVKKAELFDKAIRNSELLDPPVLTSMTAALFGPEKFNLLDEEQPVDHEDEGPMFVLTSKSGMFGASALFYPGIQEKAAAIIGSGFYVLPSSRHEVILLSDREMGDRKALYSMVKEANSTVVEPQDILSDDVYHYDPNERSFKILTA